jgi:hypothetical protein
VQGGTYYEYGNFSQGKGNGKHIERKKKTGDRKKELPETCLKRFLIG